MGKLIETKTEYRELIIMRAGWQADEESERERELRGSKRRLSYKQ